MRGVVDRKQGDAQVDVSVEEHAGAEFVLVGVSGFAPEHGPDSGGYVICADRGHHEEAGFAGRVSFAELCCARSFAGSEPGPAERFTDDIAAEQREPWGFSGGAADYRP